MKLNDHDMQLYKQIVMGAFLLGIIVGMALVTILVFQAYYMWCIDKLYTTTYGMYDKIKYSFHHVQNRSNEYD